MGFFLFLLFVLVPLAEILVFIEVGGLIGVFPTLAIVIATAAAFSRSSVSAESR